MWWLSLWWIGYGYLLHRWHPQRQRKAPPPGLEAPAEQLSPLQVSLIIPARNEAERLPALLEALSKETFPLLEVIVVDDHSTDATREATHAWQERLPFPLHYLSSAGVGKKAALLTGLRAARGEIVITLDADTVPLPGAIETLMRPFTYPTVHMSAAYVRFWNTTAFEKGDFFQRFLLAFQALEMAGILALTAGSWQRGEPITVNGAFLAYRRAAFEEVGGWGEAPHPGGDDELLMQRIYRQIGPQALAFSGAVAETRPAQSWRELWHQRHRWLSKTRYAILPWVRAGLLALGLTHLLFWGLLLFEPKLALLHLGVTGALQAWVIEAGRRAMHLPAFLWLWYPLSQLWYPVYVACLLLIRWRRRFWWRGRWYER